MHAKDPPVIRLDTHLEDQNTMVYTDDEKMSDVKGRNKLTKLTAWFKLNSDDVDAKQYLYHDIPKYYVWKTEKRIWQKRKKNKISNMIGRMYFINPNDTERFSMRFLLLHKVTRGYSDIRSL